MSSLGNKTVGLPDAETAAPLSDTSSHGRMERSLAVPMGRAGVDSTRRVTLSPTGLVSSLASNGTAEPNGKEYCKSTSHGCHEAGTTIPVAAPMSAASIYRHGEQDDTDDLTLASMSIHDLKAILHTHEISTVNMEEKSDLIHAINQVICRQISSVRRTGGETVEDTEPGAALSLEVHPAATAVAASTREPTQEEKDRALLAEEEARHKARDEIQVQRELDEYFEKFSSAKFDGLPPYQRPEGFKDDIELHPHQRDGVRWLIHQEENYLQRESPFFSVRKLGYNQKVWWRNGVTNAFRDTRPVPDRGTILADAMGLGKSAQALALLLSCPPKDDAPRATLLVCPVSVIASWQFQVEKFVKEGHLCVEVYLGPHRQKLLTRVKRKNDVDLILTSYETLMSDWVNYQDYLAEKEEKKAPKSSKRGKRVSDYVRDACKYDVCKRNYYLEYSAMPHSQFLSFFGYL
jgi:SNF2-related domain